MCMVKPRRASRGDSGGSGAGSCWKPPARSPLLEARHNDLPDRFKEGTRSMEALAGPWPKWLGVGPPLTKTGPVASRFWLNPGVPANPRQPLSDSGPCGTDVSTVHEGSWGQLSRSGGCANQPFPLRERRPLANFGGFSFPCGLTAVCRPGCSGKEGAPRSSLPEVPPSGYSRW